MKIILMVLAFFACSFSCLETSAQDIRAEGPSGKNWKQVTDLHYMNFKSVKKIGSATNQVGRGNSDFRLSLPATR